MSVLVKGMEMPIKKNGAVLIIYPDGKCAFEDGKTYQAVSVPSHGRLGDLDELKTAFPCGEYIRTESVRATIDHMPTIIPAEESEI